MSNLEMKVDALIRLCTAETEKSRAEAMATCREMLGNSTVPGTPDKEKDMDVAIRKVLLELGVPDHLLGHRYLVTALTIATKDQSTLSAITGCLYPTIAEQHNTAGYKVERAIRNAIESAWDRGDLEVLEKYFGNTVSRHKGKPTNREFIARISNVVCAQL